MPRIKPYTKLGLTRLNCIRCGEPAKTQWQICADSNIYRPICLQCDFDLNVMVMHWAFGYTREEDILKYKVRLHSSVGLEQPTSNRQVVGSSPTASTNISE